MFQDASHSDDSDFDECILQHLAAAASRARYVRRRERRRSSGPGPSQVLLLSSPENMTCTQPTDPTSPNQCQNLSYGVPQHNSLASGIPSVNIEPSSPVTPSANVVSRAVASGDKATRLRYLFLIIVLDCCKHAFFLVLWKNILKICFY